ncbi:MAG: single-stranded DNA-binding protein [Firmicutes bacterium]|nr:single-stranded DNA-binding protein [Bacillota bacterium]
MSLNVSVLIGRLVRDIELRYTPSGVAVAKFTIAVDRPYKKDGQEKEADFIDVVAWQKLAETCAEHIGKGRLVAVQGRLQTRSYDDSQGIRRKATEVVAEKVRFLDRPKDENGNGTGGYAPGDEDVPPHLRGKSSSGSQAGGGKQTPADTGVELEFNDDDIPF